MISTIGLDLAKDVFQVHGVDARGHAVLRKQLRRGELARFFAATPPCLVGMEACASAHHWARKLESLGHTVRLMAPQFVKPYVKGQKNDATDAAAICEAVSRPSMRFVPVKSVDQQAVLSLHRARQGFVRAKVAQVNQIRGLLAEFGVVMPRGIYQLHALPTAIERAGDAIPGLLRDLVLTLWEHYKLLKQKAAEIERTIRAWHYANAQSRRLAEVPGIGPMTASAIVASVGNAAHFANSRQLAAWIGLVPRQHSSGGRQVLLGVGKRGDGYLRMLLVHGARAVVSSPKRIRDGSLWIDRLLARRHTNVAVVAQANKNARIAWALLRHRDRYDATHATN